MQLLPLAIRSLPTRLRERIVARAIDARLSPSGMDPGMLPPMLRRSIDAMQLEEAQLAEILGGVRTFDAWSAQWGSVADDAAARGDLELAWRAGFVAQRSFDTRSEAREARYAQAQSAYQQWHPSAETIVLAHASGGDIVARFDRPSHAGDGRLPLMVLFPGLGVVAEELHDVAALAWERGWATLRIDGPGWGATTIRMDATTSLFARDMLEHVLEPERADGLGIDVDQVVCAGTCIGGVFSILAATGGGARYVVSVSAPWTLELLVHRWPAPVRRLVESAAQLPWSAAARDLMSWSRANRVLVRDLQARVEIHAAGHDRLAPALDQQRLAADLGDSVERFVLHESEVHACPGMLDQIMVEALERADRYLPTHG